MNREQRTLLPLELSRIFALSLHSASDTRNRSSLLRTQWGGVDPDRDVPAYTKSP